MLVSRGAIALGAVMLGALGALGGASLARVATPSAARHAAAAPARPSRLVHASASALALRLSDLPHGFATVPESTGSITLAWLEANSAASWYRTVLAAHRRSSWQASFHVPQVLDLRDPTPYADISLLGIGEVVTVWRDGAGARLAFSAPSDPIRHTFASMRRLAPPPIGDQTEAATSVTEGVRVVIVHMRIANVTESVSIGGLAGALTPERAFDVARLAAARALAARGSATVGQPGGPVPMQRLPLGPLALLS